MRRWLPIALIILAVVWFILNNVGSAQALSDISARPVLTLVKGDQRFAVLQPGQAPDPKAALLSGGTGVSFGYRFGYVLPTGETVRCTIRFTSLSCDNDWKAERSG